jgi:hypothetical protein
LHDDSGAIVILAPLPSLSPTPEDEGKPAPGLASRLAAIDRQAREVEREIEPHDQGPRRVIGESPEDRIHELRS